MKKNIITKCQILCVLYDVVAETFGAPTLFYNDNVAVRSFGDLMNNSGYSEHKSDYQLIKVAEYDTSSGIITPLSPKILIRGVDIA